MFENQVGFSDITWSYAISVCRTRTRGDDRASTRSFAREAFHSTSSPAPVGGPALEHPLRARGAVGGARERGPERSAQERDREHGADREHEHVGAVHAREREPAFLARRRAVQPVGVDVLAAHEVADEEQHERDRHPRRERLGTWRIGPDHFASMITSAHARHSAPCARMPK
jgi:hypothetical protein